MATPFEFQLNLTGQFAAALGPVNKGLGETHAGLREAKAGASLFEAEVGKLSASMGGLSVNFSALAKGGHLFTFDLAEGLRGAYEIASQLVEKTVDLGREIVQIAGKKKALDLAVSLTAGDAFGKQVNDLADEISNSLGVDDDRIKQAWLPLLQQGVRDKQLLDNAATAARDVAAHGVAGFEEAMGSFNDIYLRREVNFRMLQGFGINEADFYKQLAKDMHQSVERAKATATGKDLLNEALRMIAHREGGGLGNDALKFANSLPGTLERFANLKDNLLKQLADSPGIAQVQGVLNNLVNTLSGAAGKDLMATIGGAFSSLTKTVFGDLSGPDGVAKIKAAVVDLTHGLESGFTQFRAAWPEIKQGAADLWATFKGISGAVHSVVEAMPDGSILAGVGGAARAVLDTFRLMANPIGRLMDLGEWIGDGLGRVTVAVAEWGQGLVDKFVNIGHAIWQGLRDAIVGGVAQVASAVEDLGHATIDRMRSLLAIHSPSGVMRELGEFTTQGFAEGIGDGAPSVEQASRRAMVDAVVGGAPGSSAGGGAPGGVTIHSTIAIEVNGANVADGQQLAEDVTSKVDQTVRVSFRRLLDEAGFALGAA